MQKKLNNQYTINMDDEYKKLIDILADSYQRKPAELLRLLLIPALHNEYIKILQAGNYKTDFEKVKYRGL